MGITRRAFVQAGAAGMTAAFGATDVFGSPVDYAARAHVDDWCHHPVLGDPSWDTFEREPGNPIHHGREPYWWPVNGTLFHDPVSGRWYAYVSVYPRGYWPPPPADVLVLREGANGAWEELGYVFGRRRPAFTAADGREGGSTDLYVAYSDGKYHGVFGWCDAANRRGGLGYVVADSPEGPFLIGDQPIHDDGVRKPVLGRYVRAYASTLIKRKRDWLILHMMSTPGNAGGTWGLFAMVGPKADGPYSDPIPLVAPQLDGYHPPLAEFFPAFTRDGMVYAPATSVALNRTFQSLFSAKVEDAHLPDAWRIERLGSLWHAEPVAWEAKGIWGQTIACVPMSGDRLRALFPCKDRDDVGGVGIARRKWTEPFRDGFVLSAPNAPSYAILRRHWRAFTLASAMRVQGGVRVCWACRGPMGPDHPYADSRPSTLMARDRREIRLAGQQWSVVNMGETGEEAQLAAGSLPAFGEEMTVTLKQTELEIELSLGGRPVWRGPCEARAGRIELMAESGSIVRVSKFAVGGESRSLEEDWLGTEALCGAAVPRGEWTEIKSPRFRFGLGHETRQNGARAKWNVIGNSFTIWAPRGPDYGEAQVLLDGKPVGRLRLRATEAVASAPAATFTARQGRHAVTLVAVEGVVPCDCLTVNTDR